MPLSKKLVILVLWEARKPRLPQVVLQEHRRLMVAWVAQLLRRVLGGLAVVAGVAEVAVALAGKHRRDKERTCAPCGWSLKNLGESVTP